MPFTAVNKLLIMKKNIILPKRSDGFTMIELIIVVAILGIAAAIASPYYQGLIERQDVDKLSYQLRSSIGLGQQTAYVSGRAVTLCPATGLGTSDVACVDDWDTLAPTDDRQVGWLLFHDVNNDHQLDADETVYKVNTYQNRYAAIVWRDDVEKSGNEKGRVVLPPRGTVGSSGTFRVYNRAGGEELPEWSSTASAPELSTSLDEVRVTLSSLGKVETTE